MSVITNEKKIIGIDLFSGAGGLSLGAEMAGVEVLFAVENDPYAARTYKINHPKTKVICEDIRKIDKLPFYNSNGSLILFGGPPCQGFSTSNQKKSGSNLGDSIVRRT